MTAAQDYIVADLIAQINAKNSERASDPPGNPDGQVLVTNTNLVSPVAYTVNTTLTKLSAGAVTITLTPGGGTAGPSGLTRIQIPPEIKAGDTVAIDTPGGVTISSRVPDGYPNPGGYDRRLVVYENNPAADNYGRFFAIPPNDAFGVPFPGFTMGDKLPTAGSVRGQAFYDTKLKQGYVWTGGRWADVAASPIVRFKTDALLVADATSSTGTYAVAEDTGNLYVRMTAGWRPIGIKTYATTTELAADAPVVGSLGELTSDGSLWERSATGWRCMSTRLFADSAAMDAWTSPMAVGDRAYVEDIGVSFVRISTGAVGAGTAWQPTTIYEQTEAAIRAATGWPKAGQEAIATDSGRTFVFANGAWVEEPIQHFTTENDLTAASPPDGTLAWADDTNGVFARAGGKWTPVGTGLAWRDLTQAQYDALTAPQPTTLYIITGP